MGIWNARFSSLAFNLRTCALFKSSKRHYTPHRQALKCTNGQSDAYLVVPSGSIDSTERICIGELPNLKFPTICYFQIPARWARLLHVVNRSVWNSYKMRSSLILPHREIETVAPYRACRVLGHPTLIKVSGEHNKFSYSTLVASTPENPYA